MDKLDKFLEIWTDVFGKEKKGISKAEEETCRRFCSGEIDESFVRNILEKVIKDYGCVLESIEWNNEEIIKDCEKTGHKKYHKGSG